MARIFISYKRTDKDAVFTIVDDIKQMTGVDCWLDLDGIESGDQFQNVIIDAIDRADIIVFMLSRNFIAPYIDEKTGKVDLKRQTFPEKEVMYALNEGKRLIPVSIDGTKVTDCKWLKFNCAGLDCIDWENQDQKNKLFKNIASWLETDYTQVPEDSTNNIPNFHNETSAIFKFFSNEHCQILYDDKPICSLEGNSDKPFSYTVTRKGDYRFKCINLITRAEQIIKENIDFNEEKEVEIEWSDNRIPFSPEQEFPRNKQVEGNEFVVQLGNTSFKMIRIEGGSLKIGATKEQLSDADTIEFPEHEVTIPTYYISQYPITQNVWEVVMGYNKSKFCNLEKVLSSYPHTSGLCIGAIGKISSNVLSSFPYLDAYRQGSKISNVLDSIGGSILSSGMKGHFPAENLSHDEALEFVKRLSKMTNLHFSLPSEDEWEYAARGGQKSLGYKYSGSNNIDEVAWYRQNSEGRTHPVGEKKPNELGLYDMCGNVWEWTRTPAHSYEDNSEEYSGSVFIRRGGSWWHDVQNCRVSKRYASDRSKKTSGLGLRVVINL